MNFIKKHIVAIVLLSTIVIISLINLTDISLNNDKEESAGVNEDANKTKLLIAENKIPEIGDFKLGGVVFFIDKENKYGFVCSIEDLDSKNVPWSNTNILTGAIGEDIGTGSNNTDKIILAHGKNPSSSRAALARSYKGGGFTDWFLPSEKELQLVYSNRSSINKTAKKVGGDNFKTNLYYATSTEYNRVNGKSIYFGTGRYGYSSKLARGTGIVRPIRIFYFNNENYSTKSKVNKDKNLQNEERTILLEAENKKLRDDEEKRKRDDENKRLRDAKQKENNNKKKNTGIYRTITYENGKYEGMTLNGNKHGKGKYTWTDGEVYEGDWLNSNRTGKGKFSWTDGNVYEGDFVNGKIIGRGKMTYPNKTFQLGSWKDSKLIKEDVYSITLKRSNSQSKEDKWSQDLRYSVYVNGKYKTLLFVGSKYAFSFNKIIKVNPGDLVELKINYLKREKWYSKCTSFIVQENKYNYIITCN